LTETQSCIRFILVLSTCSTGSPTPLLPPFQTTIKSSTTMRSTSIIALTALVGISMVSAASPHGKFDRRSHKALIAERQAKEAAAVNQVSDVTKRASKKYKKRGGKVCRVKDAASASTLASASSTAVSSMLLKFVSVYGTDGLTACMVPSELDCFLQCVRGDQHSHRCRGHLATRYYGLCLVSFQL